MASAGTSATVHDGHTSANLADQPQLALAAAQLLARHWPKTSALHRVGQMRAAMRSPAGLPAHLVLLDPAGAVVAHCMLQRAGESVGQHGGFSAALTSVLVDPERRAAGLGRALLRHAEAVAARLGFGYMYLWTSDTAGFYEKCGYHLCEPVSLLRPALLGLGAASLGKLEALIAGKAGKFAEGAAAEGGGGPAEAVAGPGTVWLRRRLLERGAARRVWMAAELRAEVEEGLLRLSASGGAPGGGAAGWEVHTVSTVTWERQVGPCCGICALRMARSALRSDEGGGADGRGATPPPLPAWDEVPGLQPELLLAASARAELGASVLQAAIRSGYSRDGEIFDVHHLAALAAQTCGLHAAVVRGAAALGRLAVWIQRGGAAVVPYDAEEGTHAPARRGGHAAHYALVVGVATPRPRAVEEEPLLLLLHGLSARLLVVRASALWASCSQLDEMKPSQAGAWLVGAEGVRLSGRCLLLA